MSEITTPQGIIIWLGALGTLALYSVLYRENPVYRAAEHAFLGLATGYGLYAIWANVLYPMWYKPMSEKGEWTWGLLLVPGLMYYTIYSKRLSWMSRVVMMTMLGFEAGLIFRVWSGRYMRQISDSFRPILQPLLQPPYIDFNNLLFLVTLGSVMLYFFFSFEHKGKAMTRTVGLGRWLMMIAFGAMFGSTVMARLSLFIGRLWFLFTDWIHLIRA